MEPVGRGAGHSELKIENKSPVDAEYGKSHDQTRSSPSAVIQFGLNENALDVERYPSLDIIRITGVNFSERCLDFTIKLCHSLGMDPSQHTLMVRDEELFSWKTAPSSSSLQSLLHPGSSCQSAPTPRLRLTDKAYFSSILKPNLCNLRATAFARNPKRPAPISGRELLRKIGSRIIVHLPNEVKIVIRAQLDRPVYETVARICEQRKMSPRDHSVYNPKTGNLVDPMKNFTCQDLVDIGLRPCTTTEASNLLVAFPVDSPTSTTAESASTPAPQFASGMAHQSHQTQSSASQTSPAFVTLPRRYKKRAAPPIPQNGTEFLPRFVSTLSANMSDLDQPIVFRHEEDLVISARSSVSEHDARDVEIHELPQTESAQDESQAIEGPMPSDAVSQELNSTVFASRPSEEEVSAEPLVTSNLTNRTSSCPAVSERNADEAPKDDIMVGQPETANLKTVVRRPLSENSASSKLENYRRTLTVLSDVYYPSVYVPPKRAATTDRS